MGYATPPSYVSSLLFLNVSPLDFTGRLCSATSACWSHSPSRPRAVPLHTGETSPIRGASPACVSRWASAPGRCVGLGLTLSH